MSRSLDAGREKALLAAVGSIEKAHGKGAIMKMGEATSSMQVETIPSGAPSLDLALGVGGLPRGRIIEVFGPESSGKTTLALQAIAMAQRIGGIAAFVDAEHAMDPVYARNLGVDIDDLYLAQPDSGEQALDIVDTLVRSEALDIIVIDSVAALVPKAELEGDMGDSHVGLQARMMAQAVRKLTGIASRGRTALVFINQIREKVGVMFGSPEITPGGRALKFAASVRLEVRRVESVKQGGDSIGNRVRVKVVKNKLAAPFKTAEFDILFGRGISWEGSLLEVAVEREVVDRNGTWFSFGDTRLGQGKEGARQFLEQNPEIAKALDETLRERMLPARVEQPALVG